MSGTYQLGGLAPETKAKGQVGFPEADGNPMREIRREFELRSRKLVGEMGLAPVAVCIKHEASGSRERFGLRGSECFQVSGIGFRF
jgi:hypothetical protein